jgi:hypothetical protein
MSPYDLDAEEARRLARPAPPAPPAPIEVLVLSGHGIRFGVIGHADASARFEEEEVSRVP